MDNQALFRQFCDSPTLRLTNAMQGVTDDAPIDWHGILGTNLRTLRQIPAVALMTGGDQDIQLLEDVKTLCGQLIQQIHLAQNAPVQGALTQATATTSEVVEVG